jgi:hypothetical protein
MRYLDFSGSEGVTRYEYLYGGLVGTGRGFEAPTETRILGKILDKLEAIGTPVKEGADAAYKRKAEEGIELAVALEEAEYELAKDCYAKTQWRAATARAATAILDWFHAAPNTPPVRTDDATK